MSEPEDKGGERNSPVVLDKGEILVYVGLQFACMNVSTPAVERCVTDSDAHLHLPDVRPREKHGAVLCGHRFCRPWRLCLSPPALVSPLNCDITYPWVETRKSSDITPDD